MACSGACMLIASCFSRSTFGDRAGIDDDDEPPDHQNDKNSIIAIHLIVIDAQFSTISSVTTPHGYCFWVFIPDRYHGFCASAS
mmetsp:Transcript_16860/g.34129  ORF Transcript_16860/g.34129 Transcript_16860/m.34129 type:complete len:84 (+) Transcript_16860:591-842(+)